MPFGAQLVNHFCTSEDTLATVMAVQKGRWSSLWWSDHFLPPVIGRYLDAGREEMMFSAVPTKPHHFERIDAEVLAAFA